MSVIGKLVLRNYRCFDWDNPATIEFGNGFTALVGPNNSGKTSAIRAIYELRHFWAHLPNGVTNSQGFEVPVAPIGITDTFELANEHSPERFEFTISIEDVSLPTDGQVKTAISITANYEISTQRLSIKKVIVIDYKGGIQQLLVNDIRAYTGTPKANVHTYGIANTGVTIAVDFTLLFAFATDIHHSKYFPAFRNAINEGAGNYYDIPVGTALVTAWDTWKAGSTRAQKIAISDVEREIAGLLGFASLQINADQSGKSLDVIINGRPLKLYEVGAGVAQLIIVFAAAFVQRAPYILIDEPELNLHPALQLNFLSSLGNHAKYGVVFATHSIGLARSSAERIFAVQKIADGKSKMSQIGESPINFAEWLGELSFSNRVELGCEGLLLVEGATDVLCFQEFLRKLNLDHKYVVMQLGGSTLINSGVAPHLDEVKRLIEASKIHIFIDSEKNAEDEALMKCRRDFLDECEKSGIDAQVSLRKATENYFTERAVRKVLGDSYQALSPYENIKNSATPWDKTKNWRIARATEFSEISDTDLGKFLTSLQV